MLSGLNALRALRRRGLFRVLSERSTESHAPATPTDEDQNTVAPAPVRRAGPATILVVDDDEAMRNFERRVLLKAGFDVEEARNGLHAHNLVKNGLRPDLIVVDLRMPGLAGDVMAKRIRLMCPDQKFLFVTGYVGQMINVSGLPQEDEVVLDKPFGATALVDAVNGLITHQ